MNSIFKKLTQHSKNALKSAFGFAVSLGHKSITPQHILYGLSQEKGSIASQILMKAKINSTELKKTITSNSPVKQTITQIGLSSSTKKLLEKSFLIASQNKHKYVGTEHLLASVISINDPFINGFMEKQNINTAEVQKQITTILNSTSKFPEVNNYFGGLPGEGKNETFFGSATATNTAPQTALEIFATNLTDKTFQEEIDPVIGRSEEIDRLIQILSRRNKNNPLLLGDPGVGKTAIVEGLAKKIVQGDVPEILTQKKIYTLDLSLVVAGTSFRGEFENRLKQIIQEVRKDPDIILFIDEIHNIIGVGSATGSMDAANILKPALARGEIRCIGATTIEEFKKYIESDPALERRFQPIFVDEASVEKTIEILRGIKNNYESFHQVKIDDTAIESAATLSQRYITERFLPDKAIDLIDEAASAIKVKHLTTPQVKELRTLEKALSDIKQKKQTAVEQEKFNLALKLKDQEKELATKLKNLKLKKVRANQWIAKIDNKDIAKVVSKITGVPLSDLIIKEKSQLLKLEKTLGKKIISQDEALAAIAEFIRRSRTGISDANRPIGSFIFLGPSGVGKTELAKILAEVVFGDAKALIKIDMSEFAEGFNISKLIGAPAGYVGYKEGAKLTDSVRHRPYSVVLFDEIEKAHPQIFNLLLQILDEGHITDGTGKKINFKNTIIIMTSNIGSDNFNRDAALGFDAKTEDKIKQAQSSFLQTQDEVLKKLKNTLAPEFLSRVDKTIVFKPLSERALVKIANLQLEELKQRLANQGITITYDKNVQKIIAKTNYSPSTGARSIRKEIQDSIENKIATKILTDLKTKNIKISSKDNKIII